MRLVGLEPTRCHQRQILSLMRLPVPPQPQNSYSVIVAYRRGECKRIFLKKDNFFWRCE